MENKGFDYSKLGYPVTNIKPLNLGAFEMGVLNSEYKYNTLRMRRRRGKTTLLIAKAIGWAVDNPGSQIGFLVPHMSHVISAFNMARELLDARSLHNLVSNNGIHFNVTAKMTERKLNISIGNNTPSTIHFLICSPIKKNPSLIRGWGFNLILVDEADFMDNEVFTSGIIPMFMDSRFQQIYLASTLNFGAYMKYLKGEADIHRFAYWATHDNPDWKNWILPGSLDELYTDEERKIVESACNYDQDVINAEIECKYPGE